LCKSENNPGKETELFGGRSKAPYLCNPLEKVGGLRSRKIFESLEATARKSSIYGKVMVANNID
jgi:hypothetical protein